MKNYEEIILKRKYRMVLTRMYSARAKVNNFKSALSSLNSAMSSALKIDDETFEKETIDSAISKAESVSSTISGSIIPGLESHIW